MTDRQSLLARGNEALADGRWEKARACLEQALVEGESAAAREALSWVAWWLNDGDLTINSREAAYRLHRQAGDNLGAARMAMWVATDYEDFRGELAIGRGWRRLARRLLQDLPTAAEHGWLEILDGELALLLEDATVAPREMAERAIAIGREIGHPDLEITGLSISGLALVSEGQVDEGMARLDEATASALAGELVEKFWSSRVLCYLIYACERVRDFDRAAHWCARMREVTDRMQLTFAQGVCRMHYSGVLIWCGRWQEAEAHLEEATALMRASRPFYAVEGAVRLAELRRRQGRFDEAARIFREVEWHPAAVLGLAEVALDAGRPKDAEELVERYLRHVPESNRLQRLAALELQVRIEALLGRHRRATDALAAMRELSGAVATPPLQGAACFSAGMMSIAAHEHEQAKASLEDAVALFERSATPYEAARARLELASALVSLGRLDRARTEATAAREALERLGSGFFARRAGMLVDDIDRRAQPRGRPARLDAELTKRQIEILRLVSRGMSDREIAAALALSEHTIHRHVANILLRLDAPTRAAAAAHAASRGMI